MHPDVQSEQPGNCPKCGMALVEEGHVPIKKPTTLRDFAPLIVLFALVALFTLAAVVCAHDHSVMFVMRCFEGFFFVIFSFFKLLNWKGFVDAYGTYDLIAKRSRAYGYAYPIIELVLGGAYLGNVVVLPAAVVTFVLMSIGALGVYRQLRKKYQIPCACLGVVFKIPMTWVTFIEDVLMAVMALAMVFMLVIAS